MKPTAINPKLVIFGVVGGITLTFVLGNGTEMYRSGLIPAVLIVGGVVGAVIDDESNLMVHTALAGGLTAFSILVVFPSFLIAMGFITGTALDYQLVFIVSSVILVVPTFAFISVVAGLIGETLNSHIQSRWFRSPSSGGHTSVSRLNEVTRSNSGPGTPERGSRNRANEP